MSKYSFMGSNFSNEQVMKMSEKTINALDVVRWTPVCEFPDHYSVDDVGEIMEAAFIVFNPGYISLPAKSSFGLYLYLCGNQNTFNLWLSSADVQHALGISDSSYRRAVEDLLGEGYLIMRNNNPRTLDFYTTSQPTTYVKKERKKKKPSTGGGAASVSDDVIPDKPPAVKRQTYASYSFSPYRWEP